MQYKAEIKLQKDKPYFDQLVEAFIRPPRQIYQPNQLGQTTFVSNRLMICREDFIVISRKEQLKLQCSIYSPVYLKYSRRPCVVYLHGNSSSRIESQCYAQMFAQESISLVTFDFGGCGISEGNYVSLGWYEKEDLFAVLDHIRKNIPLINKIGLWGRSMGAVTAIMAAAEKQQDFTVMVVDTPFSSLKQVCLDIAEKQYHVPKLAIRLAFYMLRKKIRDQVNYDPKHLNIINYIKKIPKTTSIFFLRGYDDKMINKQHLEDLYQLFQGEKYLTIFQGDHNSGRPLEVYSMLLRYFVSRLNPPQRQQRNIIEQQIENKSPQEKQTQITQLEVNQFENEVAVEFDNKKEVINVPMNKKSMTRNNVCDSEISYRESDDELSHNNVYNYRLSQKNQQFNAQRQDDQSLDSDGQVESNEVNININMPQFYENKHL